MLPERRIARARKAARARWGDPSKRQSRRVLKNFLQALAEHYVEEFASVPGVLADLITPLSEWSASLGPTVFTEEKKWLN